MEGENFTTKESTELLQYIATNMVTREDVDQIVDKAKTEIMDYVDKKDREYKGELNLKIRKEDYRVDAVISTLQDKKVIDDKKSIELKKLSPFAQTS